MRTRWGKLSVVVGMLATARLADAALIINGSGLLTGATGVDVGGATYDVAFVDGTCIAVFSGCDNTSDFDFDSEAEARTASQALLDQVFIDDFDTIPSRTFGCTGAMLECIVWTPYDVNSLVFSAGAWNSPTETADGVSTNHNAITSFDLAGDSRYVWARWTRAADPPPNTTVPEPMSLLLLGTGVVVMTELRRRRRS